MIELRRRFLTDVEHGSTGSTSMMLLPSSERLRGPLTARGRGLSTYVH